MATLEERLARKEWDPNEGDELIGVIIDINEGSFARDDGSTHWYPVLVIRADDQTEWEVRCSRGGLFNPVVAKKPNVKDRVGIRYDGTVSTTRGQDAHRYRVAFDDDGPKTVDWSRMASGQQNRDNGSTIDTTPASAATEPWPEAPLPPPPPEDITF